MENDRIKRIHFTPYFFRRFSKMPKQIKNLAKEKDKIFRKIRLIVDYVRINLKENCLELGLTQ